jgi:hypothetical protein
LQSVSSVQRSFSDLVLTGIPRTKVKMAGIDKDFPGANPGLCFAWSKLTKPDELSSDEYVRWYEKVHIPDVIRLSGMKHAALWQAVNPGEGRPYLALYPMEDLKFADSEEFKSACLSLS